MKPSRPVLHEWFLWNAVSLKCVFACMCMHVLEHVQIHMQHTWMSHVSHMNESCCTLLPTRQSLLRVCVCVNCVYAYMHAYVTHAFYDTYICTCVSTSLHNYTSKVCLCMHACMHAFMYWEYIFACSQSAPCNPTCMHTMPHTLCKYLHIHICIFTHICIYVYVYIYI